MRRPGKSLYDAIGTSDMTTDDVYFERGINLRHGFLTEYLRRRRRTSSSRFPQGLRRRRRAARADDGVEKGIAQAYEIQRRLRVWRPKRAAVMGAGTIGLLAALVLRLRGLDVTVFGQRSSAVSQFRSARATRGALPVDHSDAGRSRARSSTGRSTSSSKPPASRRSSSTACRRSRKNGVLVLSSVTGGDRRCEVPADKINLEFVLGNKVMVGTVNANREYFERGVEDMALAESRVRRLAGAVADAPGARPRELHGTDRNTDHGKGCDQGVL